MSSLCGTDILDMPESSSTPSPGPAGRADQGSVHGIVMAGLDRPELIEEAMHRHPPDSSGCTIPVYVLEPDRARAEAAVRAGIFSDPSRVKILAGPLCETDLVSYFRQRLHCRLPNQVTAAGPHRQELARRAAAGLDALTREQALLTRQLQAEVERLYAERGMAYWTDRFAAIRDGQSARVLVMTSRFSTFMRHAAGDLVRGLESLGHEPVTLMEPDEHSPISPLLSLQTIRDEDPDLVIVINYPRAVHRALFPAALPHVCWLQDAMPHLFQGHAYEPTLFDFTAGHRYPDAAGLRGIDEANVLEFPVPVSEFKFHANESNPSDDRFACDIAYVSHQSEPADMLHTRFAAMFEGKRRAGFERCRERLAEIVTGWGDHAQFEAISEAVQDLAEAVGCGHDARGRDMLRYQYVHPLLERLLRHRVLSWAGEISREHGLKLRIFGKGWEAHPELADFAAGPVEHGDDLRACYAAAGVHLQASMLGCGHQRIFECALSGGLPLCLRSWDEMYNHDRALMTDFLDKELPADASLVQWRWPAYVIDHHPELKSIIEARSKMVRPAAGWDHEHFDGVYAQVRNDDFFKYWDAPVPPQQMRPLGLLGDPMTLTFSTREELEDRVLRAVRDTKWRTQHSEAVATRVRATVTSTRFAEGSRW